MGAARRVRHMLVSALQPLMLRVRSGPLEGKRWSVVSGSRFIRGTYEPATAAALIELVRDGDVVYDIGAHVGYFTAIASLRAGPHGVVYAFEPRPLNFRLLTRHVRVNGISNVRPFRSAVGERTGAARFESRTGTGKGHLAKKGDLPVQVISLDEAYRSGELPLPDVMKIDVEGGETGVLTGARAVLAEARPRIVLATHGADVHRKCVRLLESLDYTHRILAGTESELVALPRP